MTRTQDELKLAKDRLERAIALLKEELYSIELELRSSGDNLKLDEGFFWSHVVGMLLRSGGGLTSNQIYENLSGSGLNISKGGLRVFLSRYKNRQKLQLHDASGRWQVSQRTAEAALKLGFETENDSANKS